MAFLSGVCVNVLLPNARKKLQDLVESSFGSSRSEHQAPFFLHTNWLSNLTNNCGKVPSSDFTMLEAWFLDASSRLLFFMNVH